MRAGARTARRRRLFWRLHLPPAACKKPMKGDADASAAQTQLHVKNLTALQELHGSKFRQSASLNNYYYYTGFI